MWKRIRIDKPVEKHEAFVTIGNGYIHFGKYACELIPGCLENKYAEFLRSDMDQHLIGVVLSKEKHEDTLEMRRAYSKSTGKQGELCTSFRLVNAPALRTVFGELADNQTIFKYKVFVDSEIHDMFVVDISSGEPVNEQKASKAETEEYNTENTEEEKENNIKYGNTAEKEVTNE